jgi:hypothetical protein
VNTIPDPENWLDVFTIIMVALIAAVPSWLAHRNHKTINDIKSQVVNGHSSPMRSDLDKAIAAIEALGHDIKSLRAAVADEEDRRRAQIQDLASDVDRMRRRP